MTDDEPMGAPGEPPVSKHRHVLAEAGAHHLPAHPIVLAASAAPRVPPLAAIFSWSRGSSSDSAIRVSPSQHRRRRVQHFFHAWAALRTVAGLAQQKGDPVHSRVHAGGQRFR
jgi:hypothetical protein